MSKAGFYIDGFNMYGAICQTRQNHLKWLSYAKLAALIAPTRTIHQIVFFTAIRGARADQDSRHEAYISALEEEGVTVVRGRFKDATRKCKVCNREYTAREEKETDVNLGAQLVYDVLTEAIDVAYVCTTDSDLAGAVRLALTAKPGMKIVNVHMKPRAHCKEILGLRDDGFDVSKQGVSVHMLSRCLLPGRILRRDGSEIVRPVEYDPPGRSVQVP